VQFEKSLEFEEEELIWVREHERRLDVGLERGKSGRNEKVWSWERERR
jgi:hypothetical protein